MAASFVDCIPQAAGPAAVGAAVELDEDDLAPAQRKRRRAEDPEPGRRSVR